MSKIPFKVSARTARLIGRENIASSKGAIIELVKNSYDADSPVCIVYFDNKFSILQNSLTFEEFSQFKNANCNLQLFNLVYKRTQSEYQLLETAKEEDKLELRKEFWKLNSLYIIDAGDGMTQRIIKDYWMTIGTDNKSINVFTKKGRVRAGAKGIGRFALDKLGNCAEMRTVFRTDTKDIDDEGKETTNSGYNWKVRWSDFEGDFKTIESVNADLVDIVQGELKDQLHEFTQSKEVNKLIDKFEFKNGTILKITELRENWENYYVEQINADLEVLVPPKEDNNFKVFLFSSLEKDLYGEVEGSICDDFDYKLIAKADEHQNVSIAIHRREYDLDIIPPDFFEREKLSVENYRKKDFEKIVWNTKKTFSELLPGFEDVDDENVFSDIGVFEFSLYFMKKTYSTPDAEKFFYRKFRANERKFWVDKFGGIKLFRDNFRVRPYGEVKDSAFDWLGLGSRKARSPAGVAKEGGGYKVNPDNVAGSIKISRLTNVDFEDKSSREGLQENKTFIIFKKIIAEIISVFENDRAYIAREMSDYFDVKNSDAINKKKAEEIALSILKKEKQKKENSNYKKVGSPSVEVVLAELNKGKEEEIEKLKDEQKVLRGLASSGIVMASFTHELNNLDDVLHSRIDDLKDMISDKISKNDFENEPDFLNPFIMLEDMRKQDSKIQNWLKFTIGAAKKDKRTRKKLSLRSYFYKFKATWDVVLNNRDIDYSFEIRGKDDFEMRIFEIDLDSIFNNLLVNSIDAFLRVGNPIKRSVNINIYEISNMLTIEFYDNGPGLSKDIDNPEKIFNALYTTKRNKHTGDEEGTGLGMWLVKSVAEDNDAAVKLLFPNEGFGIRFSFPVKFKR